jgi:uncharacterized protein DUF3574
MNTTSLIVVGALLIGAFTAGEYSRSAAVAPTNGPSCHGASQAMTRLEMLFGTARPNGPSISDDEWASFVDSEVTPRFPAGLTVLRGPGQWRGQDGAVVKEDSRILVVWHERSRQTEADIEAVRSAYKMRFEQESVMRVEGISCVSF